MDDPRQQNLRVLGAHAEELCEKLMAECYTRLKVPLEGATPDQLLVVLHLGLLTVAYLEGMLKAGMTKEERFSTRAFLDQFSDQIERKLRSQNIQHPSTPKEPNA